MYRPNLQSVALPVPQIIAIAVLSWVTNPQSWGGAAVGVGDGTIRKSVGEFM